jgi:hypothetical protein
MLPDWPNSSMEKAGMRPVLDVPDGTLTSCSSRIRIAAAIARKAAEELAGVDLISPESARYLLAAERLARALESPEIGRSRLLQASPAVLEPSGRTRTLVEMIAAEPDDDEARLRLAKLLLRALIWRPETFPYPAR